MEREIPRFHEERYFIFVTTPSCSLWERGEYRMRPDDTHEESDCSSV